MISFVIMMTVAHAQPSSNSDWYDLLYKTMVIIGGAGVLITVVGIGVKAIKHFDKIDTAIFGREATGATPAIPSILGRFDAIDVHLARQDGDIAMLQSDVASTKAEVHLNSGSSLRDVAIRTESTAKDTNEVVKTLSSQLAEHVEADAANFERLSSAVESIIPGSI